MFGILAEPSSDGSVLAFTEENQPWAFTQETGPRPLLSLGDNFPFAGAGFLRPTWSPDHSQVAYLVFGEKDGTWTEGIAIFDLVNDRSDFLYPYVVFEGEFPSYLDWNLRRDYLRLETPDGHLIVLYPDGTNLYSVEEVSLSRWSPDGEWITYSVNPDRTIPYYDRQEANLYIQSAADGELHELGTGYPILWSPESRYLLFTRANAYWITEIGVWETRRIDLPGDVSIVDWMSAGPN